MSRDTVIRKATEADAESCHRYVAELFAERLPWLFTCESSPTIDGQRAFISEVSRAKRSIALLAFASDQVIGMLDFHGYSEPERAHSGTLGMSVTRSMRRSGVGTQLMTKLFEWAATHQIWRFELETFSTNAAAINFYERAGFVIEGCKRQAVKVQGDMIDILVMAKIHER